MAVKAMHPMCTQNGFRPIQCGAKLLFLWRPDQDSNLEPAP